MTLYARQAKETMKRRPTISVAKLTPLFTILERKSIDVAAFLADSGLDPEIAASPDRRVPLETITLLNERASLLTDDPFIGLHQGEVFTRLSNILGYVLMNCRDVAEALEKFSEYQAVVDEGRSLAYRVDGKRAILSVRTTGPHPQRDRHCTDHYMMGIIAYGRILTGREVQCQEVHFAYDAPNETSEYERLFGCKPRFSSPANALIFDEAFLRLPVLQPNRELLVVFERYAREVLKRLQADVSYADKVKGTIVEVLRGESLSIGQIAARLNTSVRSLQLKLKEQGTNYRSILADTRRDLAFEYLKDDDVPLEEIAYLLGFSESSVFHRTFKRWTNVTPGLYRKEARTAVS